MGRRRTLATPTSEALIRRLAAVLALAVAGELILAFAITERELQTTLGLIATDVEVSAFRWVWMVLAPLPWLVGALLLLTDRWARHGTAVVVTAALLALTAGLPTLPGLFQAGWWQGAGVGEVVAVLGEPVAMLLGLLAAAAALWARPRGRWRIAAPGPTGVYVAAAVLAWMPTGLQTLERSPPGAMRSFARTEYSRLDGLDAVASVSGALLVAALLFVAPRLRPGVAAVVLLTYAVPQSASGIGDIAQVQVTEFLILTPPAVLGLVGLAGVIVIAIRWLWTAQRRVGQAIVVDEQAPPSPPPPPLAR